MMKIKEKKLIGIFVCMLVTSVTVSTGATTIPINDNEIGMSDQPDWWPMFGHDPAHTGFSSSQAPETNTAPVDDIQLKIVSDITKVSSPVVVDGKLYVSGTGVFDSWVICADAFTGAVLWSREMMQICGVGNIALAVVDNYVYVNGWEPPADSCFYCLYAENGSTVWAFPLGLDEIGGYPMVANGCVYFGGLINQVFYCLDQESGTEVWRFPQGQYFLESAAVVDDRVYVPASDFSSGPTSVYCLNATTGDIIWTYETSLGPGKSPTVVDGRVYVGIGNTLYCFNATGNGDGTTSVLWSFTVAGGVTTSCAYASGSLYFGSQSKVYCVDSSTGSEIWNHTTPDGARLVPPAVADGKVYLGAGKVVGGEGARKTYNYMYCLDAVGNGNGTTDLIWRFSIPVKTTSYYHGVPLESQPAIAASTVWFVSDGYYMYAFCDNHRPDRPQRPTGPTRGYRGIACTFTATTSDPDDDNLSYMWNWDYGEPDESYSNWSAYVPSGTPSSISHTWEELGNHWVRVRAQDELGWATDWSPGSRINIVENEPPGTPSTPAGPTEGFIGEPYTFSTHATDPYSDQVYYNFSWDDGTFSGWLGPYNSGVTAEASHTWAVPGDYAVKVKAKDPYNMESNWSGVHTIHIGEKPELVIGEIKGGFLQVSMEIKNVGTVSASHILWSIAVQGGILKKINVSASGMIPTLAAGATETVSTNKTILGLGKIDIRVTLSADYVTPMEKQATAWVIGPFIFGVKEV